MDNITDVICGFLGNLKWLLHFVLKPEMSWERGKIEWARREDKMGEMKLEEGREKWSKRRGNCDWM